MNETILLYLLRLSGLWALFLFAFHLASRGDRRWAWQTRTLPLLYGLAVLIPLLPTLPLAPTLSNWAPQLTAAWSAPPVVLSEGAEATAVPGGWAAPTYWYLLIASYLMGSLWFLLRLVREVYYLRGLRRSGQITEWSGLRIVHHPALTGPFTGLRYIYLPDSMTKALAQAALPHEAAHWRAGHAWYRLALELTGVVFWFHPLHWILRHELRLRQEYEADAAVVAHLSPVQYGRLLLETSTGYALGQLPGFFSSPLKNRIEMLLQTHSPAKRSFAWLILPLAVCFGLVACSDTLNEVPEAAQTQEVLPYYTEVAEQPYLLDDTNTKPADYEHQFVAKVYELIRYPKAAREVGLEGLVTASFIITENGELEVVDVRMIKPNELPDNLRKLVVVGHREGGVNATDDYDSELLVEEVANLLEQLPPWQPAYQDGESIAVASSFAIHFKLD